MHPPWLMVSMHAGGHDACCLAQAQTGRLVHQQVLDTPVFTALLSILVIWASIIPITRGAKRESFGEDRWATSGWG